MPISSRLSSISQQQPFTIESVFTRASVAYDKDGNSVAANVPRFGMFGVSEPGLLIEESTTNILSSANSLSISSAVTTGTLNGTYTFSCRTGTITLSGGASGTVTPTNPITATISSATVTLTPGDTATYNQIENKAYPTSWTLGGTTRNAEVMLIPVSVLNLSEGTIEIEGYMNYSIFSIPKQYGGSRGFFGVCDDNWGTNQITAVSTSDEVGEWSSLGSPPYSSHDKQFIKLGVTWNNSVARGFLNGVKYGEASNPKLPTTPKYLRIGNWILGDYGTCSTLVRNVMVSKVGRSEEEMANRSAIGSAPALDNKTTARGTLTSDLTFKAMAKV